MVSVIDKPGRPKKRKTPFPTYDVVARTFLQEQYNTARWHQMVSEPVRRIRPFWLYDAIIDGRQTVICNRLNGTLLPWDHVFWLTHKPPNHWGCRSIIRAVSSRTAGRRGVTVNIPTDRPPDGFGLAPGMVGNTRFLDTSKYSPRLIQQASQKTRLKKDKSQFIKPRLNVTSYRKLGVNAELCEATVMQELNRVGFTSFYSDKRSLGNLILTDDYRDDVESTATNTTIDALGLCFWGQGPTSSIKICTNTRQLQLTAKGKLMSTALRTVAETATSQQMCAAIVGVHEFGHGIHLYQFGSEATKEIDNIIHRRFYSPDVEEVTQYAKTNHREYFAESFAVYSFEPEWMKKNAPKAYYMVRRVLSLRGLL